MNTSNNFINNNIQLNHVHQMGGAPGIVRNGLGEFQAGLFPNGAPGISQTLQHNRQQVYSNARPFSQGKLLVTQPTQQMARSSGVNMMYRPPTAPTEVNQQYNDAFVAYNNKTKEIYCNAQIFEKKININELKFIPLVVKDLRSRFQKEFEKYHNTMHHVSGLNPDAVKLHIRKVMDEFFAGLKGRVHEVQKDVMNQISNSQNLKNLEQILDKSKELFQIDPTQPDHFEQEKRIFDEKISKGRYASVVKKREFYNNLIDSLDKSRLKMNQTIDQSLECSSRLLNVHQDDKIINEKLGEVMRECINIDSQFVPPGQGLKFNAAQSAAQVATQINTGFQMSGNNIQQPLMRSAPSTFNSLPQNQASPMKPMGQPIGTDQTNNLQKQQQMPGLFQQASQQISQLGNLPLQMKSGAQPMQNNFPVRPQIQQQQQQTQQNAVPQPTPLAAQQQQWKPLAPQGNLFAQMPGQVSAPLAQAPMMSPQKQLPVVGAQPMVQAHAQDEVQITGMAVVNNNPIELQLKTFYKLKSMSLLKLIPGQGWQKFQDHQQLFMAKSIQTTDEVVFVIGGAKDQRTKQTITDVIAYQYVNGQLVSKHKSPMNFSRASFGCTYSPHRNEVFVAGGYTEGELTKKCEKYSIVEDKWTVLPEMNEFKCSQSLCVLDNKYLYSIGGLTKVDANVQLNTTIERLDLVTPMSQWAVLQLRLNEAACDIGCIPLSKDELLIFGGWNKEAQRNAYIIRKTDVPQLAPGQRQADCKHEIKMVEGGIDKPDFFLMTGVAMKTDNVNQIKVCGHAQLFTFDLKARKFICSSSV